MPNQGMLNGEHPQKPSFQLIINQDDDKFFSKLLSKEIPDASFSVKCDGLSCSVPFFWESQPGTPKHRLHEITIPPLNPPPSYHVKSGYAKRSSSSSKKPLGSKLNLFRTLFLKARGQRTSEEDDTLACPSANNATFGDEFHDSKMFSSRRTSSLSDSSLNDGDQIINGLSSSTPAHQAREIGSDGLSRHSHIRRTDS